MLLKTRVIEKECNGKTMSKNHSEMCDVKLYEMQNA